VQNKNFKISFGFFSLQGTPALLMPWMVYTIVYVVAYTIIFIFDAVPYLEMKDTTHRAVQIIALLICICK